MNFHEYQAKQLFGDYGIAVPKGQVAHSPDEAVTAAKAIGGDFWVVKAQIHAGGRGKAGGVKLAKTLDEVKQYAKAMLGSAFGKLDLVTREEFEVQREVLAHARQKLAELEARVAELEARLAQGDKA